MLYKALPSGCSLPFHLYLQLLSCCFFKLSLYTLIMPNLAVPSPSNSLSHLSFCKHCFPRLDYSSPGLYSLVLRPQFPWHLSQNPQWDWCCSAAPSCVPWICCSNNTCHTALSLPVCWFWCFTKLQVPWGQGLYIFPQPRTVPGILEVPSKCLLNV